MAEEEEEGVDGGRGREKYRGVEEKGGGVAAAG